MNEDSKIITALSRIITILNNLSNSSNRNKKYKINYRTIVLFELVTIISISILYLVSSNMYLKELNTSMSMMTDIISEQKEIIEKMELKVSQLEEIANEKVYLIENHTGIDTITYNYTNINEKSGFNSSQFNEIIVKTFQSLNKSDTKLTDMGAGLYIAEQEYNVNGLYLLGIASLESGWGTSRLARVKNNIYGLSGGSSGMSFDSIDQCNIYMGKLIREFYIDNGHDTLEKIQPIYCPPGGSKWVNDVEWCANKYITIAQELYAN